MPPKGKGRDCRLQSEEQERLLKETTEYGGYIDEDITHLTLETGARRGELINLQWANINMLKRNTHLKAEDLAKKLG